MLIYALCSTVWGLMACLMIVECSIYPAPLALHQVWSTASLAVSCTHTYSCTKVVHPSSHPLPGAGST